ncbi:MAG: hypothetical protein K2X91_10220, partial [Thermoleophilia bacterium]|nr:hypothetical protein [Thermoleophilia bacterium]
MGKIAEAYVEITGKLDKLDGALSQARGRLTSFMSGFGSMAVGLGVGAGVGAIAAGMLDAAKAAADLNETVSKTKVVFDDSSGEVLAQADDLAERFGLVRQVTLDAASNLGLVTQAAGLTGRESAQLSMRLTKLAADASSFFNVGFDEALEKIRSGLVGESEPIRSFGVLLSEDAVAAEALALGLAKSKKEVDDQAKVMARASLIIKGLAKANGDLERTKDSPTNQMKKLAGDIQNLKADFGASLTGPLTDAIKLARELGGLINNLTPGAANGENVGHVIGAEARALTAASQAASEAAVKAQQQGGPTAASAALAWVKELFVRDQDRADKIAGVQKFDLKEAARADRERAEQAAKDEQAARDAAADKKFRDSMLASDLAMGDLVDKHLGREGSETYFGPSQGNRFATGDLLAATAASGFAGPAGLLGALPVLASKEKAKADAKAQAQEEAERKKAGFGDGFSAITAGEDFWRDAQTKILGKDDTAEKALEEQKRTADATAEAVGLLGDLVRLQGKKPEGAVL